MSEKLMELAAKAHGRDGRARSFAEDVLLHMKNGVVISTDNVFFLARPVVSSWSVSALVNPRINIFNEMADAWWLYLFAGNWVDATWFMPHFLPIIGWERRNIVHWHKTSTLIKYAGRHSDERNGAESTYAAANTRQCGAEHRAQPHCRTQEKAGLRIDYSRWGEYTWQPTG